MSHFNFYGYFDLPVDHYENFPVASIILPKELRAPIETVYRFARSADDIADADDLPQHFKKERLAFFREELTLIESNKAPLTPLFSDLGNLIVRNELPINLFFRLLDAFEQDLEVDRYENFNDLQQYCTHSANPIGRILLHLFGYTNEQYLTWSDSVCTSLQIINFLQDVKDDYDLGRIYLPKDEMDSFGVTENHIKNRTFDINWLNFMTFQLDRAREYLDSGAELYRALPGRMGVEIKIIVQSGFQVINKLNTSRGNVFVTDHKISSLDLIRILYRTAFLN